MTRCPRVALFADTFFEVNGAAMTCRQMESYARRSRRDFLTVRCGPREVLQRSGSSWTLQLKRGPASFHVDPDLTFDPLFFRRRDRVREVLEEFSPDVVHVTSPGDMGILGMWLGHSLRIPVVASWHTNLHQFAARRLARLAHFIPAGVRERAAGLVERFVLDRVLWFFSMARVTLAPNDELVSLLAERTGKPAFLMTRGIDLDAFSPARRIPSGAPFTVGFVGRLKPEKNVRFLATLERALEAAGAPFRILIVGDGVERPWLRRNLRHAEFTGVLTGERLARAYASMDVFVFPSRTDTFGNVVLEAMASGVPAVVTSGGGPKYIVGEGGIVAPDDDAMVGSVLDLMRNPEKLASMRVAARPRAAAFDWDNVFRSDVYGSYSVALGDSSVLCCPEQLPGYGPLAR